MDFGTLAPETNSGRMHAGPGAGSIVEAATAWERLATRLYTAAADYRSVTARLAARWEDPAITAMAQAVIPYIDWLNATAIRAECVAYQAAAAASAHESALAAVVPPSDIQANRGCRRSLAMANSLGHASPAIADIDADYERMWVQVADAMYEYARASADASRVTPFISPPSVATEPAGQGTAIGNASSSRTLVAAPEIVVAGRHVMSTIPEALLALCSSPPTWMHKPLSSVTSSLSKLSSLSASTDSAIKHLNRRNKVAALAAAFPQSAVAPGPTVTVGLGDATSIGALSVPKKWAIRTAASTVAEDLELGWRCEPTRLVEVSGPPGSPLSRSPQNYSYSRSTREPSVTATPSSSTAGSSLLEEGQLRQTQTDAVKGENR
jgi:PPE-repeat protein